MTDQIADTDVAQLPPPKLRRSPHVFADAISIAPELSISGHEQKERTCQNCGAVKITIIGDGDNHRRAWRIGATAPQVETYVEPACDAGLKVAAS